VTQERKREKIIQDRLIHYQHIVETLRNPLAVEDKNGQIISVNHDFCEMVGYSSDELHQMTLAELVAESNRELYQHQLERQRNGETSTYELELTHRDGSSIYILVTATPIFDQLHHYRGTSSLFTNITDYKIAEQDLLDSNAELDAFAHTVAHDLKDPISVLTGFANILEKDFTSMSDSELGEYLQVITRTGDKMINIIDELLLLARMRHIDKVQMQRLNTEEIILQAIKRLQFMIEQYDARIEAVDTENWPQALGYPSWVEEVWVNYISNAIKYGGQPPKVTLGAELAENGMVRFWVKDNGRGIPPDQRNRVFTPFTRLDQVRAKGHGLGLSIVQRIVHKLGGEVSFESAVGEGSVFSFTLPVAAE
jgi:PAS domain S-box-containing protein